MHDNDAAQNDELNIVFYPYPFSNSGKLAFHRNIGGVIHYIESDNNTWSAGQCYHVSAVIDPVSGMKMYINGVLQGSTYTLTAAPNSAAEITTIGCFGDGYNRLFNGKIDEVRFWNYARSASEILNSYQHTVATSSTGLIGYWNFDEGTGTVANDISPLNHDGNVVGATWTTVGGCVNAVSENNENLGFDFSIGPNPSSESAFFSFNSDFYSSFSIAIHDETGREVISKGAIKENLIQLNDFIKLDSGLYFITVSVDDKPNLKITKRIIICK